MALGLDIEVLARHEHTASTARVRLDAFADVAARYATSAGPADAGRLPQLARGRPKPGKRARRRSRRVDTDAVQVLTVHASKGLEWDVVAIPSIVEGAFPDHTATSVVPTEPNTSESAAQPVEYACSGTPRDKGWLVGLDSLSYDLRGDRDGLPRLNWSASPDRKALGAAIEEFAEDGGRHAIAEERRLAYVAMTRARTDPAAVDPPRGPGKKTLSVPSRFLLEVRDALPGAVSVAGWHTAPLPVEKNGTLAAPQNPYLAEPTPRDLAARSARSSTGVAGHPFRSGCAPSSPRVRRNSWGTQGSTTCVSCWLKRR